MSEEHNTPGQPVAPTPVSRPAPKSSLGVPVAIVIAAALIAGAIVYTGGGRGGTQVGNPTKQIAQETAEVEVAPVTEKDHIRGNPNAPIVIVEYSDYDCPFCKNFHETMQRIMAKYGADGKVAWVYRQFPIQQLHPNAPKIAEAAECVANLGGNDAFWKFSDLIFGERAVNEQTNILKLPDYAVQAGVNKDKYLECMNSGTFAQKVADDITAATKAGARGTPYSILIAGDQQGPINGAQPYATVEKMVETVLSQISGGTTE
jgi:protein-disulfide isomerase